MSDDSDDDIFLFIFGAALACTGVGAIVGGAIGAATAAAGAAAAGAAGGAVTGAAVGAVAGVAVGAISYIADKWKKVWRTKVRDWIHRNFKDGSWIKKILVAGYQWIDDGMCQVLKLKAKLIAITKDNSELTISDNDEIPYEEAKELGLLTERGEIRKRPKETFTAEEILEMANAA